VCLTRITNTSTIDLIISSEQALLKHPKNSTIMSTVSIVKINDNYSLPTSVLNKNTRSSLFFIVALVPGSKELSEFEKNVWIAV